MKSKTFKFTILFLALLLPVCIFLFLRNFGNNQFDIPIYYQSQIELDSVACDNEKAPYHLEIPVFRDADTTFKFHVKANIIIVLGDSIVSKDLLLQLKRINNRLPSGNAGFIILGETNLGKMIEGWQFYELEKNRLMEWKKCALFSLKSHEFVLVDGDRNIRGYYDCRDIDEVDRLIVEVKILNTK